MLAPLAASVPDAKLFPVYSRHRQALAAFKGALTLTSGSHGLGKKEVSGVGGGGQPQRFFFKKKEEIVVGSFFRGEFLVVAGCKWLNNDTVEL